MPDSNGYGRENRMQIKVENVTKKIGQATVLDQISMELESGMIYGLKGRREKIFTLYICRHCIE